MARLGDMLGKQGRFLIENDLYALVCIAVLTLIPFAAWLSAAIIALITLRKGWLDGFKGFAVAVLVLIAASIPTTTILSAVVTALIAFLPCYLTAAVLHSTASWRMAGLFIVAQALLGLVLIHWLVPEFISKQYQYFLTILKEMALSSSDDSLNGLLNNKDALSQIVNANYLMGIQAVCVVMTAIASLLLARSVQARLYYPGGFRQEMLMFRASGFGVILLAFVAINAYLRSPLAISCLPMLVTYYLCAGLSLGFSILAKDKDKGIKMLILLIVPLILLPYVVLPIYALCGALDSFFNFRLRLATDAGGKENKG